MTRRAIAVGGAVSILALVLLVFLGREEVPRIGGGAVRVAAGSGAVADEALARLRRVPFYRGLLRPEALRSASLDGGGTVRVEIDLPALLRPRLARPELAAVLDLLPRTARGAIRLDDDGAGRATVRGESWVFEGPAPLLDILARGDADLSASRGWDAIPGAPAAIAAARIVAARLADPAFGGDALATWRERAEIAERVLGRPLRAEIADDLAGPVVFALYEAPSLNQANALLVVELKRTDRLSALLESVFALGALTERATVRRYRDVATASFRSGDEGPALALAVDGPLLLAASSRDLLEAAIDARRGGRTAGGLVDQVRTASGSWTAVATSAFVAHGWARLARAEGEDQTTAPPHDARLIPEGATAWRLSGEGPGPAITTDPVMPFLRSVFGGRQRGAG